MTQMLIERLAQQKIDNKKNHSAWNDGISIGRSSQLKFSISHVVDVEINMHSFSKMIVTNKNHVGSVRSYSMAIRTQGVIT